VQRLYNPAEVVRIEGRPSARATIFFGDGEHAYCFGLFGA
jgi:hypothetical protein